MRVIEIQSGHIGEDHLAATLDKCRHRRFMLRRPILYDVSGIDIFGFQNIVPADGALAVLFEDSDDTLREVAREVLQAPEWPAIATLMMFLAGYVFMEKHPLYV